MFNQATKCPINAGAYTHFLWQVLPSQQKENGMGNCTFKDGDNSVCPRFFGTFASVLEGQWARGV